MDTKSDYLKLNAGAMKAAFIVGLILCFCFAIPIIANYKKNSIAPVDSKLNPNTAKIYELEQLPAIGSAKAKAIADYRQNEKFETAKDIEKVKGIGEKTVIKIEPYLRFEDRDLH
ncbi:MAG: helix-hairpin-helix domain-containing protein [Phycisphaerales bacterium]